MTVKHLKIFISVYETGSITKAANELYTVQPAVSRAVKELENYYNIRLFERTGHGIMPTENAKELYAFAKQITGSFDLMEKSIKSLDKNGRLRIGATITLGTVFLPVVIKSFKSRYPEADIRIQVRNGYTLENMLRENKIDIALIENSVDDKELTVRSFGKDSLKFIAPPDYCGEESLSPVEISRLPLLMREKGSAGRSFTDSVFEAKGIKISPVLESVSTRAIIEAVHSGLGYAFLPEALVYDSIKSGYVKEINVTDISLCRTHYIVTHKYKYLSEKAKDFIDECVINSQLKELKEVISEQLEKYPLMTEQDVVKLIFQNEFGSGHFISSPEESLRRLKAEAENTEFSENIPEYDYIGNGIKRININSKANENISLEKLNTDFVSLSQNQTGSRDNFIGKLDFVKENFSCFAFDFSYDEFEEYINDYIKKGCMPVSHSEKYRKAYNPKYRIVR